MVFLTLICPGCQKSTVIDDDDEDSYCMHCGTRFDRQAVESASELDPVIGAALQMSGALGEPYEPVDYSGEPWYQGLDGIESMLSEGDSEAAAEAVAKLLDENPESAEDIETCVRDRITGWVVDCIVDGEPYIGGIADIARVVEEYGEDSGPNILVASMFYALTQTPEIMRVPEDAGVMAESLFNLLMEYPQVEPDIREQLEMCTDFMHVSGLMIDDRGRQAVDLQAAGLREAVRGRNLRCGRGGGRAPGQAHRGLDRERHLDHRMQRLRHRGQVPGRGDRRRRCQVRGQGGPGRLPVHHRMTDRGG